RPPRHGHRLQEGARGGAARLGAPRRGAPLRLPGRAPRRLRRERPMLDQSLPTRDGPTLSLPAAAARPAAPRAWAPGDVVDDLYEVAGVLGEGGMGTVYRVRHRGWGVDLAVKTPRAALAASDEARRRFIREAEAWVELGLHPHVAQC